MAATTETETTLTAEAVATLTAEAAAVIGRRRYRQGNIGTTMMATTGNKDRHHIVVNDGDWYYNEDHGNDVYNDDNHVDDL